MMGLVMRVLLGVLVCFAGTCYAAAPLITRAEFVAAVTWASPDKPGFPAPTDEQYFNILARAANGKITTKTELAMFLANVLQESGGLRYKKELNPPAGAYSNPPLDVPGKQYYGRGYLQLSWSYNYRAASQALYGDDRLLRDPDQVANIDSVAWDTAFWFWGANVHGKPGVSAGKFGATVNAINGDLECGPKNAPNIQAKNRFAFYKKIAAAFRLPERPVESGCYN